MSTPEKAVVLLSGGMDSATCLAIARASGHDCHALSFRYGQRHAAELNAAREIAVALGACEHRVLSLDLASLGGSALTDRRIPVPEDSGAGGIPVTYVPARNTIFLAFALGLAEVVGARYIYAGVNAVDYSGYPDCRPEYIAAFQALAKLATKQAVEGQAIEIVTPLIHLSKAEIVRRGIELGVDYARTVSCYQADAEGRACGRCDACRLRAAGFAAAGVADPTRYRAAD
ncbi:MAG: 7-cyano-7-deazaguanine synthase QueC [Gammaproteobacteria bacterium]|nr:MAG: 7-cyano-7-deazaguanine synthase QueC [Gammaproteobacteria bacterium]